MSIKKRGSSYEVRWRRDGVQYSRSFVRHSDAVTFELDQKRARQLGAHAAAVPSRDVLDSWLDEWWASESPGWAEATKAGWKHSLDRWVRPYIGQVRLADLGARRVREWRAQILDKGATPSVANHAKEALSAALGCAVESRLLPSNPCAGIRKLPLKPSRPRALTPLEVERIASHMPSQRDRVLVTLLAYAGLRPGEALALTWDSVRDHLLIIDRNWTYGELKHTKTTHRRTVEIIQPLADDLAALRPARAETGALVIATSSGEFLNLHNWRARTWKTATAAAGVKAAIYDLRHSYASLLIHEGRSLPHVAAAMGHATANTTAANYLHLYDETRLGTGRNMVDAILEARRSVRKSCATSEPRRLRQSAPTR
jgi:integrase